MAACTRTLQRSSVLLQSSSPLGVTRITCAGTTSPCPRTRAGGLSHYFLERIATLFTLSFFTVTNRDLYNSLPSLLFVALTHKVVQISRISLQENLTVPLLSRGALGAGSDAIVVNSRMRHRELSAPERAFELRTPVQDVHAVLSLGVLVVQKSFRGALLREMEA